MRLVYLGALQKDYFRRLVLARECYKEAISREGNPEMASPKFPKRATESYQTQKQQIQRELQQQYDKPVGAFRSVWTELFQGSAHLDSALSRQPRELKSELARTLQALLRRPVSESHALGLAIEKGLPWSLGLAQLANWEGAVHFYRAAREKLENEGALPGSTATGDDYPPWLLSAWEEDWGSDTSKTLQRALGEDPPLAMRASRKLGAEDLLNRLRPGLPGEIRAVPSVVAPFGAVLSGYAPVFGSEAFQEGLFEIQDEGSQFMSLFAIWPEIFGKFLQPSPGPSSFSWRDSEFDQVLKNPASPLTVVDACAGAGGKTLALADALEGRGRVYAYDTSAGKIQALRKRASRAGLRNIQGAQVEENKEEELVSRFRRRADVVLVDAPCSGWGVLRRNPDIKWRGKDSGLDRMPGLQKRILTAYSDLVAPGGSLVFGVCTFRKSETRGVVDWFSERNPDFSPVEGGYIGPGGTDGFFMQRFRREGGRK